MDKIEIFFCTCNKNKLKDLRGILGGKFMITHDDIDLCEIQGSSAEIVHAKAKEAYRILKKPLIVEDTCLCFNAFNGLPGPYIKYFLREIGVEGLSKLLAKFDDKSAYALCTFGYVDENGIQIFEGKTKGRIVESRGPTDFGWNSVFEPEGFNQTYAEMSSEQRNLLSHRYKAAQKLKEFLLKINEKQ